jgi:threonine/homoserine/homoserine lactone efflux protein
VDLSALLSLIFATFVYAISPGPGLFAVLVTSTRYNAMSALYLSVGHVIGDMLYVSIAIFALDFLVIFVAQSLIYIQIIGGMYLMFMGIQQYRNCGVALQGVTEKKSPLGLLVTGFVVGGTNPKAIIYYLSFLPLLIDLNGLIWTTKVQMIVTVGLTVLLILSLANVLGLKLRAYISNPKTLQKINQTTGMLLLLVGFFVMVH